MPVQPVTLAGEFTRLGYRDLGANAAPYTMVANRVTVDGPNLERDTVETTVMPDEVGTSYRTYRPSNLLKPGEFKLKIYYNPKDASHQDILDLVTADAGQAVVDWELTYSDGCTWQADGFVSGFNPTGANVQNGIIEVDVTITLTGEITVTLATD